MISLPLNICAVCRGEGAVARKVCAPCGGRGIGILAHEKLLFWKWEINQDAISWRLKERAFNKIIILFGVILILVWLGIFGWEIWAQQALPQIGLINFWLGGNALIKWLGGALLIILYLGARSVRQQPKISRVAEHLYNDTTAPPQLVTWQTATKMPTQNIATAFSSEARQVLERAFLLAVNERAAEVSPSYIFRALLENKRLQNLFLRLLVLPKDIATRAQKLTSAPVALAAPLLSMNFWQTVFNSYETAWQNRAGEVDVTDLLESVMAADARLTDLLFEFGIQGDMLANMLGWFRVREEMAQQQKRRVTGGRGRGKGDTNRTMTAIATPYLNSFSEDLTRQAWYGNLSPLVGRETEISSIFRIMQGGGMSVLLVGQPGTGRRALIQGIAQLMIAENVPEILKDKRLVELDIPRFIAGASVAEAEERLLNMLYELQQAGNVVLAIPAIERLIGSSGEMGLDAAGVLATELNRRGFLTIATTTPPAFQKFIAGQALGNVFQKVEVDEMNISEAIRVLEAKIGYVEYEQRVWFTYQALAEAVNLSQKYLPDRYLPAKAVDICQEVAQFVISHKGKEGVVTKEDVAAVISEKTKIPVTAVTEDESQKLMRLEKALHERVVGQDEAVTLVANALRRSRAEIRSGKRPIASFLFLGPTGVGKTELAKTIAEVYFGDEKQIVRQDMSEFQDTTSIYRMIGRPGEQGTGVLTEAVRQKPFSIVLLDEIEKAAPNILDLFLQVLDDGRLTDSVGRVIDFTNTIIVMTSNAGTTFVQEQIRANVDHDQIKNQLIHGQLKNYFRPEFLNRFDALVLFKALTETQIQSIARLILASMGRRLEERGIFLRVTDRAVARLAHAGFDPEFGARPLRRVVQDQVENAVAGLLLQNQVKRKDTIVVDENGIHVEPGAAT